MPQPPDWLERAARRRRRKPQSKPVPTPPPFKPSEVWTRSGVFTRSLSSFYGEKREAADAAGYEAVAIHVDRELAGANMLELRKLRSEFDRLGWAVCGWATYGEKPGDPDPRDHGGLHASIALSLGLDGFWANGEAWAEGTQNMWKTAAWMAGWREYLASRDTGLIPVGLSCLSSTTHLWAREMDYKPFLDYPGAIISPQVYSASHPDYTVVAMKQTFQVAKVPLARVVPTFDVIEKKEMPTYPKTRPRWLWTGEDCRVSRFALT